ncbi:MAG TPA: response regulator [Nitrososphaeraceae archaeon]|nr:response regulator [Nitrososphaeraceae archaeon]
MANQKIKILTADDNMDVNTLIAATLILKGYEVYKTYSADECLSKLEEFEGKVNVLLLNGKIAAERGTRVIVETKRINPDIKILAIAEDENEKTRVLDYGADGFTTKPISVETIVNKISALLVVGKSIG